MSTELLELVEFLHAPQAPVRAIALENLAPFATPEHRYIFKVNNFEPIKDLKNLLNNKDSRIVQLAASIMANLCDDREFLDHMANDDELVSLVAREITNLEQVHADILCILLSNLAKNDNIVKVLNLKRNTSTKKDDMFKSERVTDCLMDCFVKGADRKLTKYADFNFLAFFFADISRFAKGRQYMVTKQDYDGVVPLTKLLVFTEKYDSKIRRTGVASTIKNILFDVDIHENLVMDPDINILPYILLPLAGPEDFREDEMLDLPDELQFLDKDKKRDPDSAILTTHVESLLLLSSTRRMREYMRKKSVYPIIRELHLAVEDEDVRERCERLVNMLMRDEAPDADSKITELDEDNGDGIEEIC